MHIYLKYKSTGRSGGEKRGYVKSPTGIRLFMVNACSRYTELHMSWDIVLSRYMVYSVSSVLVIRSCGLPPVSVVNTTPSNMPVELPVSVTYRSSPRQIRELPVSVSYSFADWILVSENTSTLNVSAESGFQFMSGSVSRIKNKVPPYRGYFPSRYMSNH